MNKTNDGHGYRLDISNSPSKRDPLGSSAATGYEPYLPACHREELKRWISFAYRELREKNTSIPDDVLDYIRDAANYFNNNR